LDVNRCPLSALEALPGVGRRRAVRIFHARPLSGEEGLREALDDQTVAERLMPFLSFGSSQS
jgi:radical SAM superfamily enzyme with C-terminal helix-hairpin-helix motif